MLAGTANAARGQGLTVVGRVLAVERGDSVAPVGVTVVLHLVTLDGGEPVDSSMLDATGTYRLHAPSRDTTAIYIPSVDYKDITYFGTPIRPLPEVREDTSDVMVVYDTTSVGPPLHVAQKHVVIRRPGPDGTRSVLELLVIENRGLVTRIVHDPAFPAWQGAIPSGVLALEIGESDVSPDAIFQKGDSIALIAAVPPGEKQVIYQYTLPANIDAVDFPVDQPIDRFQLLLEDTTAAVAGGALERVGIEQMESVRFLRYEGSVSGLGGAVRVEFGGGWMRTELMIGAVVGLAALALLLGLVKGRGRAGTARVAPPENPDALAARIAALDVVFERLSPNASPAERDANRAERAALKARLAAALAEQSGPT